MRQAPSEAVAGGASVKGAPTRSVRGKARKREGGQERPGVRVVVGVLYKMLALALGEAVRGICHASIPRSRMPSDVRLGGTYGL